MTDLFATITEADTKSVISASLCLDTVSGFPTANEGACNLTVLALDLGTTTGWALAPRGGVLRSGSFRLDPSKLGGNGRRWIGFREWLTAKAREVGGVHAVYFEDVKNHAGVIAAHVYGGYLAMLEAWCAANNIPLHGVGVGTAKKAWTGNGRASKDQMISEAERRGITVIDDNHADALAILAYAVEQEQA